MNKKNEAQYDLDRKAVKTSDLTGEDLNYKPSTVEQAKLDYSPLGRFLNKGLKEEVKKKDF